VDAFVQFPLQTLKLCDYGFSLSGSSTKISAEAFSKLCSIPCLEGLTLGNYIHLKNDLLVALGQALPLCKNLKTLEIGLEPGRDNPCSTWPLTLLAKAFEVNTVLETFITNLKRLPTTIAEDFIVETVKAIHKNPKTCLKKLQFRVGAPLGGRVDRALLELLEMNCTLISVRAEFVPTDLSSKLSPPVTAIDLNPLGFYLQLNASGRRQIMERADGMSKEKWVNVLADHSDNPAHVQYYLRMNPWLCHDSYKNRHAHRGNLKPLPNMPINAYSQLSAQIQEMRMTMEAQNEKIAALARQQQDNDGRRQTREVTESNDENSCKRAKLWGWFSGTNS
jgi:hypothetical protein